MSLFRSLESITWLEKYFCLIYISFVLKELCMTSLYFHKEYQHCNGPKVVVSYLFFVVL